MKHQLGLSLFIASLCPALYAQDSNFKVISELVVGELILDIATGDFNQDNNPDLAVLTLRPGPVGQFSETPLFLYLGRGDGTLYLADEFDTPNSGGVSITIADFNGDGTQDLIRGREGYTINSDGSLNSVQEISRRLQNCDNLQVLDVDNDGAIDGVCSHNSFLDPGDRSDFGISVLKNFGNFDFHLNSLATKPTEVNRISSIFGGNTLVKGDTNNDGIVDIALVSNGFPIDGSSSGRLLQHHVGSFLGTGNGFNLHSDWTTTDFFDADNPWATNGPRQIVLTDTDNDNNLDLVVIVAGFLDTPSPFISVHKGDGTGDFNQQGIITPIEYLRVSSLETFDANDDGNQDLIIGHASGNQATEPGHLVIMHGNGDGGFAAPTNVAPQYRNTPHVVVADFNNDGRLDIVSSAGWDYGRIIVVSDGSGGDENGPGIGLCTSADSDPDGDGWGWENNQSCVAIAVTPTTNTGSGETNVVSNIAACTQADSDPDNDGWGWENNDSCQVGTDNTSTVIATCLSSTSDSDGDGWGWENNSSCRVQ